MFVKQKTNVNSEEVELTKISPILRTLLNSNGIVINSLEACFQESIKVECLYQDSCAVSERQWPEVQPDEAVLFRNVLLKGVVSGKRYAYATSLIRLKQLDAKIVDDLLIARQGIGEIINKRKIETYREIIEIKNIDSNIIKSIFEEKGDIISRKYKIVMNGIATMLITEYYPLDLYADVS